MTHPRRDTLPPLFAALEQLRVLYVLISEALYPWDIISQLSGRRLEMPLKHTLEELRFDYVNQWGEERVAQFRLCREGGGEGRAGFTGGKFLTGDLERLNLKPLLGWPGVSGIDITSVDGDRDGDKESDGDWEDEDEDEDSEDDENEENDEDESDYEDDWEAEGDWSGGAIADVPVPVPS